MKWQSLGWTVLAGLTFGACDKIPFDKIPFLGGGADQPEVVAEKFWTAGRDGDAESASSLSLESATVSVMDSAGSPKITGFMLGPPQLAGDQATVPTELTTATDPPVTASINTRLSLVGSEWKVDVDRTMNELTEVLTGPTPEELAQQIEEAQQILAADAPAAPNRPQFAMTFEEEPWFPELTGTVAPGMTIDEVVAVWGDAASQREIGSWTFLFFRNGCELACGTFDLVMFQGGQVVDAVVRGRGHTYAGISSSPPDRPVEFTAPTVPVDTTGAIG